MKERKKHTFVLKKEGPTTFREFLQRPFKAMAMDPKEIESSLEKRIVTANAMATSSIVYNDYEHLLKCMMLINYLTILKIRRDHCK